MSKGAQDKNAGNSSDQWWELEKQIKAWEDKRRWYSRGLPLLIVLILLVWPGLTYIGGAMIFVYVGLAVVFLMAAYNCTAYFQVGFPCPACGRKLKHIAEILLLQNLKQCPRCQADFKSPEQDKIEN